ncbi:hypothetical protein COLO4_37443 [Corchorus olitorius]|uniref:Uncharacterized protein n=1 Tax=Corchorus olitorius TaxID=93759 RepID=A0A1R3G1N8_9ROSI|nr:hypothetical protein COLO4_37443 [Corchorus olitorius]
MGESVERIQWRGKVSQDECVSVWKCLFVHEPEEIGSKKAAELA